MQNIQYITRKNLNVSKYDVCIRDAVNSRIYAYSWYLDIVAEEWDVLVLGDYKAVMPLPKRRKYFIPYIYQPAWTQQLGVFYKEFSDSNLVKEFIDSIPKKFKKISLNLNDQNICKNNLTYSRDNYVLSLNSNYKNLFANYSKNRRNSLRKINRDRIKIVESTNHQIIFPFYYDYIFEKSGLKEKDIQNLDLLLNHCYTIDKALFVKATTTDNKALGGAVFLKDNNRLYYLFSALGEEGKRVQVMSLIIDYVINKYSGQDIILDFEGSMIRGIASFFRSFGAKNIPYYSYEKSVKIL